MRRTPTKAVVGVCAAIGLLATTAGTAGAGEINGKGDPTPIGTGGARNSICAFSGLQDGEGPEDPVSGPGHVQTPHGEPDYDLYFPPGSASVCQWVNNGYFGGHSKRPQEPPPFEE